MATALPGKERGTGREPVVATVPPGRRGRGNDVEQSLAHTRAPRRRRLGSERLLCLDELIKLCVLGTRGGGGISNSRFLGDDV